MKASEIRELLKLLDQPGVISFAGGIPDPKLFPAAEAAKAYADALASPASASVALQYSVSEGYPPLTRWIAAHMAKLGVPATQENIVVTCGSQQGLDFAGKLLLSPNDTALVTAPTYLGALQAFSAYEPRYDTLRPEHGNRTPQSYREAASAAGGQVKFAYVVPDFANPTGETLTLEARRSLAFARRRTRHSRSRRHRLSRVALRRRALRRRFRRSTSRGSARSTPRASSISAHSPRRLRRACASAGSAPRAP